MVVRYRPEDEIRYEHLLEQSVAFPFLRDADNLLADSFSCADALFRLENLAQSGYDINQVLHGRGDNEPQDLLADTILDGTTVYVTKIVNIEGISPIMFDTFGNIVRPIKSDDNTELTDAYGREIIYITPTGKEIPVTSMQAVQDIDTQFNQVSQEIINPYRSESDLNQREAFYRNMSETEQLVWRQLFALDEYHYAQSLAAYRKLLIHDFAIINTANLSAMEMWMDDWIVTNVEFINAIIPDSDSRLRKELILKCTTEPFGPDVLRSAIHAETVSVHYYIQNFARTQSRLAIGMLSAFRQHELGIRQYEWLTAGDAAVRGAHQALNGVILAWDHEPIPGHPGHDVNCRCIAIPR